MNKYSLANQHILLTGGSSGIGRGVALRISDLGAKVTIVARNQEKLCKVLNELTPGDHAIYSFDLNRVAEIEALVDQIVRERGKFDGMMYCAGQGSYRPFNMSKPTYMHEIMSINFFGFAETLRCVSKAKNCNHGASFIGMSSDSSLEGNKSLLAYSASKAAMNSAIRCASKELAAKGLRVNGIATGFIANTGLVAGNMERVGADAVSQFAADRQLLGMGKPEFIADAAAFLLSDAAKFITGTIMVVDGGYLA